MASGENPPTRGRVRILLVDDDPDVCSVLREILLDEYRLENATSARAALTAARRFEPDIVLLDLHLGRSEDEGFDVLDRLRAADPDLPVIILSSYDSTDAVVRAMKAGAAHYVGKTPRYDELHERIRLVLRERRRSLRLQAHRLAGDTEIVGSSPQTLEVRELALAAAGSDIPVLLLGETGTGKGLVARFVHRRSARRDADYLDVNVAGLSASVLDSELFGHERGAFTGADKRHRGLFELAAGGTILLDEIGDLSRESQVKLLKVVEEGRFRRMGGERDLHTDTRILAATHADLEALVSGGTFRRDLYHRLAGLTIRIPPLRERKSDIPELAAAFLGSDSALDAVALETLAGHDWPGNVRELQQTLRRAQLFAKDPPIRPEHLARALQRRGAGPPVDGDLMTLPYSEASTRFQREYLTRLLRRCAGNVSRAARESGITRSHLHALIRQHGLGKSSSDD